MPAKDKSTSYKELPSTNWKYNSSPDTAPSNSGVDVSSPQTASDCWPPTKSSKDREALPRINPEEFNATK